MIPSAGIAKLWIVALLSAASFLAPLGYGRLTSECQISYEPSAEVGSGGSRCCCHTLGTCPCGSSCKSSDTPEPAPQAPAPLAGGSRMLLALAIGDLPRADRLDECPLRAAVSSDLASFCPVRSLQAEHNRSEAHRFADVEAANRPPVGIRMFPPTIR